MVDLPTPSIRPTCPHFSSGPCAKRPGWSLDALADAAVGRSHRSTLGKAKIKAALERTAAVLGLPAGYRVGLLPGSDTGAFETALWSLLGPRGVDVVAYEAFGQEWARDVTGELRLPDARVFDAPYGRIPDLHQVDTRGRDVVVVWNGTTSGARIPHGDWIAPDRQGLVLCDATSAVFAQPLPWDRLDVTTFSWQKVLGGEAAHGMMILSPRAVARLESYTPPWPMPKLFRLTKGSKLQGGIFSGSPINTPSLLCIEDYLDVLAWVEAQGGLEALHRRADANLAAVERWVERTPWVEFLAADPVTRSNTSVCLSIVQPELQRLDPEAQRRRLEHLARLLEEEAVGFDLESYRDAPPGLRLWCGATVETADLEALFPWIEWAYQRVATA
jgi:phosphoserine aminotransferase